MAGNVEISDLPMDEAGWQQFLAHCQQDRRCGELNHSAKLTAEAVREIRRAYATDGISQYQLAKLFGVSQGVIFRIVHGRIWRGI